MTSSHLVKTIPRGVRFSTLSQLRSQVQQVHQDSNDADPIDPPTPPKKYKHAPFTEEQKAFLDRVIRVDQAGELGADYIYAGQYQVLSIREPALRETLKHMWDQEIHHHNTFNKLQVERRVRPSLITPLWKVGAFAMGVGTALLGKEAAMACTVAVETVIGGHYNDQLRVLAQKFDIPAEDLTSGEIVKGIESQEMTNFKEMIRSFRDDELEHLDTAVEHDAEKAVPYWLLTEVIKGTCKAAVWTAERV